ncbi:MAG: hypothetical protein AVDCRST_MAG87-451, partial [uncultured Thermomicrobiales bacterium]
CRGICGRYRGRPPMPLTGASPTFSPQDTYAIRTVSVPLS